MGKYFDKFPLIDYNGTPAKNIMSRVAFSDKSKKDIQANFDYTIDGSLTRADNLSNAYYNSPYYDWVIYLANDIIDPYHDYYKNEEQMQAYLIEKYGSIEDAKRKILFYRNNWAPDDSRLNPNIFDNLSPQLQKYYNPIISNSNQVIGYNRKQEDWIQSTNQIVWLSLNTASIQDVGDMFVQGASQGQIIDIQETGIILQHIKGNFIVDSIVKSIDYIKKNIADEEVSFWASVSAYDEETEKNELKRNITMIKAAYLQDIEKSFNEEIKK
jgi:hypothetical protein